MINFSKKELQQYTKSELIFYLLKIQSEIPHYAEPIKDVILWKRSKETDERITEILKESTKLVKQYNETLDLDILIKLKNLNKERDSLWKKDKKIQKELFNL